MKKMTKTKKYIHKYCEDENCKQNAEEEISNYLEGRKFTLYKVDNWFNQIYKKMHRQSY